MDIYLNKWTREYQKLLNLVSQTEGNQILMSLFVKPKDNVNDCIQKSDRLTGAGSKHMVTKGKGGYIKRM